MIRRWYQMIAAFRTFGHVYVRVTSNTTFDVIWNANYPSTWSLASGSCAHHTPILVMSLSNHKYAYSMQSTFLNCDRVSMNTSFVLKNDDLDVWRQYHVCE